MKKLLLLFLTFFSLQTSLSQEKSSNPFFTGSLNFTLGRNQYDEGFGDDEPFFVPAALFIRTGFGYQFKKRIAISFNVGYDYHWHYTSLSAFPTYATLRFNITEDNADAFYVETSYGKMWKPSFKFTNGNYYSIGLGTQVASGGKWHTIIKLDYHRKAILDFNNKNKLESLSLGIGFIFF